MTSGDLTFDLLKNDRRSFLMISDALSNAAYCVSLPGPEAELDKGEGSNTPGRRVRHRAPAGAG